MERILFFTAKAVHRLCFTKSVFFFWKIKSNGVIGHAHVMNSLLPGVWLRNIRCSAKSE